MSIPFLALRVSRVHRESETISSLIFRMSPQVRQQFRWRAGQSVLIKADVNGKSLIRAYSISAGESDSDMRISVKRVRFGGLSDYLVNRVTAEHTLLVSLPFGNFTLPVTYSSPSLIMLIGAGSGVFPLYSLALTHLLGGSEHRCIFVNQQRNEADAAFYPKLTSLADRFADRMVHKPLFSQPANLRGIPAREKMNASIIAQLIASHGLPERAFICGPRVFEQDAKEALIKQGVVSGHIKVEHFTLDTGQSQLQENTRVVVKGTVDGEALLSGQVTLLQGLTGKGISVPYGCLQGTCNVCRCQLVEGEVSIVGGGTESAVPSSVHPVEGHAEQRMGHPVSRTPPTILACQTKAKSPRLVLQFLPLTR